MSTTTYKRATGSKGSGKALQQERNAKREALMAELAQFTEGLDQASLSAAIQKFDGYSDNNALLIAMQDPQAEDVEGFAAWHDRGREVKAGEHGIRILVPAGSYVTDAGTDQEKRHQLFKVGYVFDIRQTITREEGAALRAAKAAAQAAAESFIEE
jgi:hypothetical protein